MWCRSHQDYADIAVAAVKGMRTKGSWLANARNVLFQVKLEAIFDIFSK